MTDDIIKIMQPAPMDFPWPIEARTLEEAWKIMRERLQTVRIMTREEVIAEYGPLAFPTDEER